MLFLRLRWQEDADSGSMRGGCLAATNRDVPLVFLGQLPHYPEAEASAGIRLRREEWQISITNRFRIEPFTVIEDGHSHSRTRTVPPVPRFRNPQLDCSVLVHRIERVRHQVREY